MLNKPKVLIVDDDKTSLALLESFLKTLDINLIQADSGKTAVQKAKEHNVALILLDVMMDDINGFEAAQAIQRSNSKDTIPIIFITNATDDTFIKEGYKVGAVDYILKPINPDIITSKVKIFLQLYNQKIMLEDEIAEKKRAQEEKERLQERIQQAQKMESIGILANGIAHNFNNILGAVQGFVEMSLEDVGSESRTHGDLTKALTYLQDAKELSNQMLIFSRKHKKVFQPTHIQTILQEIIEMLQASIGSPIDIQQNIDQNCGPVLADANEIKSVFINLFTNAYDAMSKENDELKVSLQEIEIDDNFDSEQLNLPDGNYALLTISDSGQGMNPTTIKNIFDPFFTTKDVGKGTGLGLSVAHGIISSHKGAIDVESVLEMGTTFKVYLPLINNHVQLKHDIKKDSALWTIS